MRVAINGIGVAGPTLAYWLKAYGHEPVMYEKAEALRTGGYIIDFWGLGYDIAERMGILPSLLERCYRMERMRIVGSDGSEVAGMNIAPLRDRIHGRFISLSRADLAAELYKACDGVPAHFGTSIVALKQGATGVEVSLSNGAQERFDAVVGADGLHSKVRALAFGTEPRFESPLGCHVAAFRVKGYPQRDELTYVSHTVPKRQVARVSLRNDETLFLLVCRSELIPGDPPREHQKDILRKVFEDMRWEVPEILNRMDEVDDLYFDRVSQIHIPRWSAGCVALAGDAAACASLLAGEGTGLAMTEAYVLAGELHRAAGDVSRAFAAYEARLRGFVTGKQKQALSLRAFFAPRSELTLSVRNIAVRAFSWPFLAKHVVARSLQDKFSLPEYSRAS